MAHDQSKQLLKWLDDAYAMEKSMIKTLEKHAKDADDYPQLKARIEEHIEETKQQADTIHDCIERLGGSVSGLKGATTALMGGLQGITTAAVADDLVKNTLVDYAAEHYEIAAYKAIEQLATRTGDADVAEMCREIIAEEQEMADFLDQHIVNVVDLYANEELEPATNQRANTRVDAVEPAFGERLDPDDDEIG